MSSLRIIMGLLLAVAPVAAHDCHAYGHHSHHGGGDCAASIETWKGTVSEIRHGASAAAVTEAWVKTADGAILVRLAPAGFLSQNRLALHEGDPISGKGYRPASSGDDLLIATEVELVGKTLLLRTPRGKPLW